MRKRETDTSVFSLIGPPNVYDQYLTAIIVKENLSYRAMGAAGPFRGDRV